MAQVVAIQTARVTKYAYQELLKWTALPYDRAIAGMQASEAKLRADKILESDLGFSQGALPLAALAARPELAHLHAVETFNGHVNPDELAQAEDLARVQALFSQR